MEEDFTSKYIATPLSYSDNSTTIIRDISDTVARIDNLIELIVFTPRGSFHADADFGFEFWNYEYSNVHYKDFNDNQNGIMSNGLHNEPSRKICQESIKKSLEAYESSLKNIDVSVTLCTVDNLQKNKTQSKYQVRIIVEGIIPDSLETITQYHKEVSFFIEPTAR